MWVPLMYGLTEIQLMNLKQSVVPVTIQNLSSPRNLARMSAAVRLACELRRKNLVNTLDVNLVPPITEGERQARREAK